MDKAVELIEKLIQIEQKYNMYEKEVYGVKYWIFLRRWITVDLKSEKHHNTNTDIKGNISRTEKMKIGWKLICNSYFRRYSVPKDVKVMISSHPRRVLHEGMYECTYTSILAEALPDALLLERPNPYEHLDPIPEKNILYVDRSIIESNIFYKWIDIVCKKKKANLLKEIKQQIGPVLDEINRVYQVNFSIEHYTMAVYRHILLYRSKRKYYEKLIKKYKPKVIMEVVSYLPECLILSELGKKYRIPTIELQHGVIDATHPAYNFGPGVDLPQLPDYIFEFSDYWKAVAPKTFSQEQIKVVGYPYFERELKKYKKEKTEPEKENFTKKICFISQWTIGTALSQLAIRLEQLLKEAGENYKIYYKLHPGEYKDWKEKYPWLLNSDIEVIKQGDISLYEMFSECHIQIGVASTAIFEGMGFGLKTLIYQISDAEVFEEACNKGYARFINHAEEILEEVKSLEIGNTEERQSFWKMNSLQNILDELNMIMGEKI